MPVIGGFQRDSDETEAVNFFLGFSPEGLRAWDVQRGHLKSAVHARDGHLPMPESKLTQRAARTVSSQVVAERADELNRQRAIRFCISILEARQWVGETTLEYLIGLVQARFRDETTDFASILAASDRIAMTHDADPLVYLVDTGSPAPGGYPPSEPEGSQTGRILFLNDNQQYGLIEAADGLRLRFEYAAITNQDPNGPPGRGQVVRFILARGTRGYDAREVDLLPRDASFVDGEVVAVEELPRRVEADLRQEVERRLAEGAPDIDLATLQGWLEDRFVGGMPLAARLRVKSIDRLWSQYSWLTVTGRQHGRRARLTTGSVFGRVPPRDRGEAADAPPTGHADDFETVLSEVVNELKAATGKWPQFNKVQTALQKRLGDRYPDVVRSSLRTWLERAPGWKLEFWRVSPTAAARRPSKPVTRPEPAPDPFGSALHAVAADLERNGKELNLQLIGAALRARMGVEAYTASVGSSLKRRIEREPGWRLIAARPSINILVRDEPASTA